MTSCKVAVAAMIIVCLYANVCSECLTIRIFTSYALHSRLQVLHCVPFDAILLFIFYICSTKDTYNLLDMTYYVSTGTQLLIVIIDATWNVNAC